jgi:hypothetical protein
METDMQAVADWAEVVIVTQKLTTEARDIIHQSELKVIDVSSSDYREVARTNIKSPSSTELSTPILSGAV